MAIALRVFAHGEAKHATLTVVLKLNIDDARDRVRTVLRRRAVTQNLDAFDSNGGDGVHVGAGRAAADRVVDMNQRGLMTAFAVYEYERLVGPETAQRRRTQGIGSVRNRRTREVE